jgi:hypothetical protein
MIADAGDNAADGDEGYMITLIWRSTNSSLY